MSDAPSKNGENGDSPRENGTVPIFPISRWRSLVWVLPERVARRLAWAVVLLAAVLPLAVVLALIARNHYNRTESRLAKRLATRLCTGVRIDRADADATGHWQISGLALDDLALSAESAEYQAPGANEPGRLDLENGTLAVDLGVFAKPPGPRAQKLLNEARARPDLRALSFARFAAELSLLDERVALAQAAGSVLFIDDHLRGAVTGAPGPGRLTVTFEITDASRQVSVAGARLPWTAKLLARTLGDALAGALDAPDGWLTIGSALVTGAEDDAWRLDAKSTLDLARLPADLGLGGMTGALRVELEAFGPLGGPATLHAKLSAPKGGAAPAAALRNLAFLFDATLAPVDDAKPVAFESLDLNIIVTRDQVFLTGPRAGRPAGLYAPGGAPLMTIPTHGIPLRDFTRRLDQLRARWDASHAS